MKLIFQSLCLLPLLASGNPLPDQSAVSESDSASALCGIRLTGFGDSVNCIKYPADPVSVYKFTGKPIRVECFIAGQGKAYYRTNSPNGNCYVEEKDLLEGSACRININGVIC